MPPLAAAVDFVILFLQAVAKVRVEIQYRLPLLPVRAFGHLPEIAGIGFPLFFAYTT